MFAHDCTEIVGKFRKPPSLIPGNVLVRIICGCRSVPEVTSRWDDALSLAKDSRLQTG